MAHPAAALVPVLRPRRLERARPLVPPMLLTAALARGWRSRRVRLYVDGARRPRPTLAFCPPLKSFAAALATAMKGRVLAVLSDLGRDDARLTATLGRALGLVGSRLATVEAGVFVGDYGSTAFGVHQDEVDVVMQVLFGRKRLWLWRPEDLAWAELAERGGDYRAFTGRARQYVVGPGELVCWPRGWWHVGESLGPSGSLNVALHHVDGGSYARPRESQSRGLGQGPPARVSRGSGPRARRG